VWVLKGNSNALAAQATAASGKKALSARQAIRQALATPSYRYLSLGFFVCGFHVAFLATHLPGVVAACGLPPEIGGWALAMIGLFNIVGSLAMGWAVGRWRMKSLLALLYATRGIAVLVFLLAPKTPAVMLAHQIGGFFGAFLGGYVFQATGSYDWVWYIDIVLAAGAALVNLPIREAVLPRQAKAAA
jgi:predicted MFS family arabinose efflux permease